MNKVSEILALRDEAKLKTKKPFWRVWFKPFPGPNFFRESDQLYHLAAHRMEGGARAEDVLQCIFDAAYEASHTWNTSRSSWGRVYYWFTLQRPPGFAVVPGKAMSFVADKCTLQPEYDFKIDSPYMVRADLLISILSMLKMQSDVVK